jgi:hypothetical protein
MAVYYENFQKIDLEQGQTMRSFINRIIGEGDNTANRFGVEIYKNNNQVSLTGAACVGYFTRPDRITLIINGSVEGNKAWVDLPEAAYAKEGTFTLSIKISGTGFSGTLLIIDGSIVNTTSGDIADPASELPSLSDYETKVVRAEAAAATINKISVSAEQITGTRYRIAVTKQS